jgi:hypothetical protein
MEEQDGRTEGGVFDHCGAARRIPHCADAAGGRIELRATAGEAGGDGCYATTCPHAGRRGVGRTDQRAQLALELFPEDSPPSYPDDPSAIVVSVSGGLDSDYAALWARRRWPTKPLILWHAHLEGMDWPETQSHLEQLALVLGNCRIVICQAVYELNGKPTPSGCNGTSLRRIHLMRDGDEDFGPALDDDAAAITTLLDLTIKARNGQPPTKKLRYCTDYFKIRLFNAWARQNRSQLGERAVLLSGERWAESPQRAADNRPDVRPIIQSVQSYEQQSGYTWQQRGPLTVSCAC